MIAPSVLHRAMGGVFFGLAIGVAGSARAGSAQDDVALYPCAELSHPTERLACFDARVRGAPSLDRRQRPARSRLHPFIRQLAHFERTRSKNDSRFRMTAEEARAGRRNVLISAPALNQPAPRSLFTISCIDSISRLQLVVYPALPQHNVRVSIRTDDSTVVHLQTWQVMADGLLVDAGRGLAAIEVIRRLGPAKELLIGSDEPQLDGLRFDATGLSSMIAEQRQACRW